MSIQVRNVTKTFGRSVALEDVSFDITSGELVALLGPSGSGKTTLLRLIAGLEDLDPGGGSIRCHGEDMTAIPVRRRRMGFVFQHYALFRHMSVFENVAFGLKALPRAQRPSRAQIRARVHELLDLVQLSGLAARYPSQLSGGQRQRVALARALAVQPRVLLLDEPFGALDARVRAELRHWVRRLHDELHITSVFVTHDQEEALEIADRVVVMSRGRIEQIGAPEAVYHAPQTEFVMNFLGQANAFDAMASAGAVEFAGICMPLTDAAARGGPARAFVRPHDLDVLPAPDERPSFVATVLRIRPVASSTRLDLQLANSEVIAAELSEEGAARLDLARGRRVFVAPRRVHVFSPS